MEWIDVEKELPPKDGNYVVTNDEKDIRMQGCLYYDGIGFLFDKTYRPVKFWRHHSEIKKRYGKIA